MAFLVPLLEPRAPTPSSSLLSSSPLPPSPPPSLRLPLAGGSHPPAACALAGRPPSTTLLAHPCCSCTSLAATRAKCNLAAAVVTLATEARVLHSRWHIVAPPPPHTVVLGLRRSCQDVDLRGWGHCGWPSSCDSKPPPRLLPTPSTPDNLAQEIEDGHVSSPPSPVIPMRRSAISSAVLPHGLWMSNPLPPSIQDFGLYMPCHVLPQPVILGALVVLLVLLWFILMEHKRQQLRGFFNRNSGQIMKNMNIFTKV